MTFLANEQARESRPVELYTFARRRSVWRYAGHDADVALEGFTYRAAVITRGAIRRTDETGQASVAVTLAGLTPLAAQQLADPLGDGAPCTLTIVRVHVLADGTVSSVAGDRAAIFLGTVGAVAAEGGAVELTADTLAAAFERPLLRMAFTRSCNHVLGDYRCGVDVAPFTTAATVTAVGASAEGPTVTVTLAARPVHADPALVAAWFDGGVLVLPAATHEAARVGVVRTALADAPSPTCTLTLVGAVPADVVGTTVSVIAGCARTRAVCVAKFDNVVRFGGFADLPERNPLVHGVE